MKKIRSSKLSWLAVAAIALFAAGYWIGHSPAGQDAPAAMETAGDGSDHAATQPLYWTCSMHPQIQQPDPGQCPICSMDLIPVFSDTSDAEAVHTGPRVLTLTETARRLAQIAVSPALRQSADQRVRMVGKLDYDETRERYLTSWIAGRIDKLYIDFTGTEVRAGQPVAEIYSPEVYSAREELRQALRAEERLRGSDLAVMRETATATVRAARQKLRLLGLTDAQIRTVEAGDEAATHITVFAPAGGVVVHKDAQEGLYINAGTKLYTVVDLSTLWLQLDAYESNVAFLAEGQTVGFTVEAYPGEVFEGTIAFIEPVLTEASRTIKVRVSVANRDGRLRPGMFARAEVWAPVSAASGGQPLLVPASAVLQTGKRSLVYVQLSDNPPTYEGREIVLGARVDDNYIVEEGLAEGDLVVTNGNFKIDSAIQLQARPSMMSPEGGAAPSGHNHGAMRGSGNEMDMAGDDAMAVVPAKFSAALEPVYDAYFSAVGHLEKDEFDAARASLGNLSAALDGVDMELVSGDAHMVYMEAYRQLQDESEQAKSSTDAAALRAAFAEVSRSIIALERNFGHAGVATHYLNYCPMAFDGQGGEWLAPRDGIRNPYYGPAMSSCGEQRETFAGQ